MEPHIDGTGEAEDGGEEAGGYGEEGRGEGKIWREVGEVVGEEGGFFCGRGRGEGAKIDFFGALDAVDEVREEEGDVAEVFGREVHCFGGGFVDDDLSVVADFIDEVVEGPVAYAAS